MQTSPARDRHDIVPDMQPRTRRTFITSWMGGTLIVLGCQIVALMTPSATPGGHTAVLIGPTTVVFPALAVNLIALALLIRMGGKTDDNFQGKFNRAAVATTAFLGSLLT